MFIPRALRLRGVHEKQRPKASKPPPAGPSVLSKDDELVDAMEGISTNSPEPQLQKTDQTPSARGGSKFTTRPVTPEYIAQLAAGIELIFSDYAHQEALRSKWLQEHYRTVDGEEKFVHLTALLENTHISTLKPEATQVLLQQALRDHPSALLELSSNNYHVRRKPSTYPPKYLPHNSFKVVNDDGVSFWDQRTIYVEPHLRNICKTPAKVAHWLVEHGALRPRWLPVQAVHMLYNSCAFVVLGGSVMHEETWEKWRAFGKPENWKIMTKVEHTRRTAEYVALLEMNNPRAARKNVDVDSAPLPPVARPAVLAPAVEVVPEYKEAPAQPKAKRKRNRKKGTKADADADAGACSADVVDDEEPCSKRRG